MSGPANGWAPAWPAGEHSSFEAALAAGGEVRSAAIGTGPSLPRKDLSRLYPSTMQDAVAVVHARLEENKKKAAASKQKSKSKSGAEQPTSDSHFPGARPGAGDPSAFWLYIEVRCLSAGGCGQGQMRAQRPLAGRKRSSVATPWRRCAHHHHLFAHAVLPPCFFSPPPPPPGLLS